MVAINPGGLEVQGFGEREPGVAALVTLDEGTARVERLPIGRLRTTTLSVDVGELTGTEALVVRLAEHADPELLLRVELTGLAAPGVLIDAEEARARLADSFFALRIEDASHPRCRTRRSAGWRPTDAGALRRTGARPHRRRHGRSR